MVFPSWPACQETSVSVAGAHEKHEASALVFSEETLEMKPRAAAAAAATARLASPHRLERATTAEDESTRVFVCMTEAAACNASSSQL